MPIYFGKEQKNPFTYKGIEGGIEVRKIQGIWTGISAVHDPDKGIMLNIENGNDEEEAVQNAKNAAIKYIDEIKR